MPISIRCAGSDAVSAMTASPTASARSLIARPSSLGAGLVLAVAAPVAIPQPGCAAAARVVPIRRRDHLRAGERSDAPPDELMRIASTFLVETTAAGAAYQLVSPTSVR